MLPPEELARLFPQNLCAPEYRRFEYPPLRIPRRHARIADRTDHAGDGRDCGTSVEFSLRNSGIIPTTPVLSIAMENGAPFKLGRFL
jgi:hypothetical protein